MTAGVAVIAGGSAILGLTRAMMPTDIAGDILTIDLATIAPGTQVTVKYRQEPIFIRHRTPAEIAAAEGVDPGTLWDPLARNATRALSSPATDANRRATSDGAFLVLLGVCPHEGCVPLGDGAGDFGGWFCPCCAAHFDTAGRLRKGIGWRNMGIPPYRLEGAGTLVLLPSAAFSPDVFDHLIYG
jgi:ubiquinol-cytochrome c reductase iron-sulfur subunit